MKKYSDTNETSRWRDCRSGTSEPRWQLFIHGLVNECPGRSPRAPRGSGAPDEGAETPTEPTWVQSFLNYYYTPTSTHRWVHLCLFRGLVGICRDFSIFFSTSNIRNYVVGNGRFCFSSIVFEGVVFFPRRLNEDKRSDFSVAFVFNQSINSTRVFFLSSSFANNEIDQSQ